MVSMSVRRRRATASAIAAVLVATATSTTTALSLRPSEQQQRAPAFMRDMREKRAQKVTLTGGTLAAGCAEEGSICKNQLTDLPCFNGYECKGDMWEKRCVKSDQLEEVRAVIKIFFFFFFFSPDFFLG